MKKILFIKLFFGILLISIVLNACNNTNPTASYQPEFAADTSGSKTLIWGFPSFSYCENAEQIVKYLNKNLTKTRIIVKACVNWDEYVSNLNQNKFDITLVNGLEAVEATRNGYSIIGKISDDSQNRGVIFTRKDAGINKVTDLSGKSVALVQSDMIPGTMMPLYYLFGHGLNVNDDIIRVKVSSFESVIITTGLGKSEAGICMKRNWMVYVREHPEILSRVELKWETPPMLNNALLVKNSVDNKITDGLITLFVSMHTTGEGKAALKQLGINGFERANGETYKPLMDFKKKYDSVIH